PSSACGDELRGMLLAGTRAPTTLVDAMQLSAARQPMIAAADWAICCAPSNPALPVKALALPLLTTRPRALPPRTLALHHSTGADAVFDFVKTPATCVPGERTASSTSVRSL